jgi:hypothetical protein
MPVSETDHHVKTSSLQSAILSAILLCLFYNAQKNCKSTMKLSATSDSVENLLHLNGMLLAVQAAASTTVKMEELISILFTNS